MAKPDQDIREAVQVVDAEPPVFDPTASASAAAPVLMPVVAPTPVPATTGATVSPNFKAQVLNVSSFVFFLWQKSDI
jgi:hypothetical protein